MAEIPITRETNNANLRIPSGLNILLGIWLIISPWIYGYTAANGVGGVWNSVIVGIIIAVLAAIRFFGAFSQAWMSWINALLGLWMIISPWVYNYTLDTGRMWNSIIVGILVVIFGVWSALASRPRVAV